MSEDYADSRWSSMYAQRRPVRLAIIHLIDMAMNNGSVEIDEAREELWAHIKELCEQYYYEFNTKTKLEVVK